MPHPIHEYFNRIMVYPALGLSADGRRLAYQSSITGAPQVWVGDVNPDGGLLAYPRPLTFGKEEQPHIFSAQALDWVGNDLLLCLMDRHGDEQTFIDIHDFKTGAVKRLPQEKGAKDYLGFASKDRRTYHFQSTRGNPAAQGLYGYDFKTGTITKWYQHESRSAFWLGEKMFRGQYLFARMNGSHSNSLHLIHPKTKKVTDLFDQPGSILSPVGFKDHNKMVVVTNHGRQFMSLATYDVRNGDLVHIGVDKWDIESAEVSPNKKQLLISRNVAGRSQLELYAWPSLKKQKLGAVPNKGIIDGLGYSQNSQFAVFGYSSPTNPRDFYRLNLKTKKVQQLTNNWTSRIPQKEFVQSQLVQFDSAGQKIYSWLFLPKGAKRDKSLPVVIWPHGGPQAQERAQFRPIFQYFAARGFAVWAPNHTGSTGFGKDFTNAINGQWGTADLPDMKNGIAWLKASGWVDPDRLAIMGGSYGGYMTLRTLTQIPQTFKAGVDIFGVSNLITFVTSVPPDWVPYMDQMVGNPDRDAARLREQSPITTIEKIDCPLLVIQGAKDPRVVKAESDQVVERLKKGKLPVEYLVFEDEGHGFLKLDNELKAYTAAADFLEKYL